jgi:hypothetical protein
MLVVVAQLVVNILIWGRYSIWERVRHLQEDAIIAKYVRVLVTDILDIGLFSHSLKGPEEPSTDPTQFRRCIGSRSVAHLENDTTWQPRSLFTLHWEPALLITVVVFSPDWFLSAKVESYIQSPLIGCFPRPSFPMSLYIILGLCSNLSHTSVLLYSQAIFLFDSPSGLRERCKLIFISKGMVGRFNKRVCKDTGRNPSTF